MADKTPPPPNVKPVTAPAVGVKPKLGELPGPFDPKALASLADARDKLRSAESLLDVRTAEKRKADEQHEHATAALNHARAKALEAATALLGTDLADNILSITDDEAERLRKAANDAHRSLDVHVRAKLFG